ncbi:hypothetical protein [Pseudomonas sp. 58 R 12]|nr:hypothetical protein [Pseudomonas sp. 58 R 12]CRM72920.1 hypothetical protein [Pseudomonas sp. 35 E 8]
MAAHFKKVVRQPYPLGAQDIGPDSGDLLLQFGDGLDPQLLRLAGIGLWQRLAIQFAIRVQRHAFKENQVRRHHVVRQLFTQSRLQGFGVGLLADQIGHQLVVGSQHQGFTYAVLGQQQRFDFPQLDTKTTDFHLMVDPADVLDYTVSAVARQVTRAVQALTGFAERVRYKTLGRQQRPVQIGTRQAAAAADVQLAHGAQRRQVQVTIQHIQRPPWQ